MWKASFLTSTNRAAFASVVCPVRRLKGWSQRELAARIGTTQRYIWEIEAGKPSIFMERLFVLMRETGTELTASIGEKAADE